LPGGEWPASCSRKLRALLPFRPFAREWLVLALIALATFAVVQYPNTQDRTRLSLTQALLEHGDTTIERYGVQVDRARHGRHLYTDKAPGLSLAALVPAALVRAVDRVAGRPRVHLLWESRSRLQFIRFVVLAPFLLLLTWLVGRVAEGLARGTGAAVAVTAALATMLGPLATVLFAHVAEAALCFAAFVVFARRPDVRSAIFAGALAGTAVLMDYEAALFAVALGVYVLSPRRVRLACAYIGGAVPAAFVLGVYDAVSFGSPLRLSYHYKAGPNAAEQSGGFFGIGLPHAGHLATALVGARGLLRLSPVLVAAAAGLVLLWRRGRRGEATLAGAVVLLYLAVEAGYFSPFGGFSPGPRFFAPAVPFLLLGLPLALAARPAIVAALAAVSLAVGVWNAFTFFEVGNGAWPKTIISPIASRPVGIAFVAVLTATAGAVAALAWRRGNMGDRGFEPRTSALSERRSNQLS
jgi:hypothetical protein